VSFRSTFITKEVTPMSTKMGWIVAANDFCSHRVRIA